MKVKWLTPRKMRRAVSPVIAVVLLIALTVAAVAIIWGISSGFLSGSTASLIIESSAVADKNGDSRGDLIELKVRNIGSDEAIINDVTLLRDGVEIDSWALNAASYSIDGQQIEFIQIVTAQTSDEVYSENEVHVTLLGEGVVGNADVIVPSSLSAIPIFFEDNSFTNLDIQAQGWETHVYNTHGGTTDVSIIDGDVVMANNNNDILFWLNNDTYKVKNGIIDMEFEYGDNDGVGIAFRIVDATNYYWIGYTIDHNAPGDCNCDPPSFDGPRFVADYRFELHKIVDGVSTLLASASPSSFSIPAGTASNLRGPYKFVASFSGDTIAFQAGLVGSNLEELFTFSGDSAFTEAGYFGFFSLAAQNTRFNGIQVTG
ncbi:MAG: type IV pilin [Candidatus Heimdallarchaeota archaeon]|nr:type IV pilin [Candidatus Heimdallarchaeota archaeon]